MFEIESKKPDEITITTKKASVTINVAQSVIDANLTVGKIQGPGEFEIGDITIRGIDVALAKKRAAKESDTAKGNEPVAATEVNEGKAIYDVEIGGIHVGVIGDCEDALDDLGIANILCTSSVRAVREIEPRVVVSMGNIDGMVTDLKLTARTEKKLKVKNLDSLPTSLEVVALS